MSFRSIVDKIITVPSGADTRDTESVNRIATAYLKLLFPNVRSVSDIKAREFTRYCLKRACKMRAVIRAQLAIIDLEYRGKSIPEFTLNGDI